MKIVVAEDDREVARFYAEALALEGHRVAVAEDGRRLVELCREFGPDLVVTDERMPGMRGLAAAAEVCRERPVPVVLVTAYPDADTLARAAGLPVVAFLTKPVRDADLRAAVALGAEQFRRCAAAREEAAELRRTLEDRKLVERAKGVLTKRLRVDEGDAYRRLRQGASGSNRKLVEAAAEVLRAEEVFAALEAAGQPKGGAN